MCVSNVSSRVNAVYRSVGWDTLEPYKYDQDAEEMLKLYAESIKYIDVVGGEPFYNKKLTTNNKTQGDVMNNNTLIMDTILHGATIGNTEGVAKLVEMMSAPKPKPSKSIPEVIT